MFTKLLQSQFVTNMVAGWIRHGAAVAVPVLIASGVMQNNQANDFVGSVVFLGALGWSGVEKYMAKSQAVTPTPAKAP